MVNPLRRPVVLMGFLLAMILFVHEGYRPDSGASSIKDAATDETAPVILRRANDLLASATSRASQPGPTELLPVTQQAEPSEPRYTAIDEDSPVAVADDLDEARVARDLLTPPPTPQSLATTAPPQARLRGMRSTELDHRATGQRYAPTVRSARSAYIKHRIVDGDTLRLLAGHYLGDESRYLEIFAINRDTLVHPDLLPLGSSLRIPRTR